MTNHETHGIILDEALTSPEAWSEQAFGTPPVLNAEKFGRGRIVENTLLNLDGQLRDWDGGEGDDLNMAKQCSRLLKLLAEQRSVSVFDAVKEVTVPESTDPPDYSAAWETFWRVELLILDRGSLSPERNVRAEQLREASALGAIALERLAPDAYAEMHRLRLSRSEEARRLFEKYFGFNAHEYLDPVYWDRSEVQGNKPVRTLEEINRWTNEHLGPHADRDFYAPASSRLPNDDVARLMPKVGGAYTATQITNLAHAGRVEMTQPGARIWSDLNVHSAVEHRIALGIVAIAQNAHGGAPLDNIRVWMATGNGKYNSSHNPADRRFVPSDDIPSSTAKSLMEEYGLSTTPVDVPGHPVFRDRSTGTLWVSRGLHLTASLYGDPNKIAPLPDSANKIPRVARDIMALQLGMADFLKPEAWTFHTSLVSLVHGFQQVEGMPPAYRPMAVWGVLGFFDGDIKDLNIRPEGPKYTDGRFVPLDELHKEVDRDQADPTRIQHLANAAISLATRRSEQVTTHMPPDWLERLGTERCTIEPALSGTEGWRSGMPEGMPEVRKSPSTN